MDNSCHLWLACQKGVTEYRPHVGSPWSPCPLAQILSPSVLLPQMFHRPYIKHDPSEVLFPKLPVFLPHQQPSPTYLVSFKKLLLGSLVLGLYGASPSGFRCPWHPYVLLASECPDLVLISTSLWPQPGSCAQR